MGATEKTIYSNFEFLQGSRTTSGSMCRLEMRKLRLDSTQCVSYRVLHSIERASCEPREVDPHSSSARYTDNGKLPYLIKRLNRPHA
jgi:hypothetical protein